MNEEWTKVAESNNAMQAAGSSYHIGKTVDRSEESTTLAVAVASSLLRRQRPHDRHPIVVC